MKPSRDLLKIQRHLSKVPQAPTVEDELASALERARYWVPANAVSGDVMSKPVAECRTLSAIDSALARYRASKTK